MQFTVINDITLEDFTQAIATLSAKSPANFLNYDEAESLAEVEKTRNLFLVGICQVVWYNIALVIFQHVHSVCHINGHRTIQ